MPIPHILNQLLLPMIDNHFFTNQSVTILPVLVALTLCVASTNALPTSHYLVHDEGVPGSMCLHTAYTYHLCWFTILMAPTHSTQRACAGLRVLVKNTLSQFSATYWGLPQLIVLSGASANSPRLAKYSAFHLIHHNQDIVFCSPLSYA